MDKTPERTGLRSWRIRARACPGTVAHQNWSALQNLPWGVIIYCAERDSEQPMPEFAKKWILFFHSCFLFNKIHLTQNIPLRR